MQQMNLKLKVQVNNFQKVLFCVKYTNEFERKFYMAVCVQDSSLSRLFDLNVRKSENY